MTSTTRWLDEHEQSAWRGYLAMQTRLAAQLNRDLQAAAGLSHSDYAVLVQLSEHAHGRMRVLELARALGWEKSRLSHQLSRMQQRGLIARVGCPDDRRGSFIELTDTGRRTIEDAAPAHVDSVRNWLFDNLTAEQVDALAAISARVLDKLEAACAGVDPCESGSGECGSEQPGEPDNPGR
jgi:DNA-binding MarR family transcriptional regulator